MQWIKAISPSVRQGLTGRRNRTILLAVAVAMASALVAAVGSTVATAQGNLMAQIQRAVGREDARLVNEFSAQFPASMADRVKILEGVRAAAGRLRGSITVASARTVPGELHPRRVTLQARGVDLGSDSWFEQVKVTAGQAPKQRSEVMLDAMAMEQLAARIGDALVVQRFGTPIILTICGTYERPRLGALQRGHAQMARDLLAEAIGADDEVTAVAIVLQEGVDAEQWVQANRDRFKAPLLLETSEMATAGVSRAINTSRLVLWIATMVASLACAFIVATGLTTALAEQQREIAMMRSIGATQSQVFAGQLAMGLVIGVSGVLVGVPLGLGLAWGLSQYLSEVLPAGFIIEPSTSVVAGGSGLLAAIGGAAYPAFLATQISPLRALAVRATVPRPRSRFVFLLVAMVLLAGQWLILLESDTQQRFWIYMTLGVPLLSLGWFCMGVPAVSLLSWMFSRPLERVLRLPAGLLSGSMQSSPLRHGMTAGALMIGLALLTETWTNGTALLDDLSNRIKFADAFVFRLSGFKPAEQELISGLHGVDSAVAIGYLPLRLGGKSGLGVEGITSPNVVCIGFPPREFFRLNRIDWVEGSPEEALPLLESGSGVLVAREFLNAHNLHTGDSIELGNARQTRPFTIAGVVGAAGLDVATQFFGIRSVYMEHAVSCVFMDLKSVAREFGADEATIIQLQLVEGSGTEVEDRLTAAVAEIAPGAQFASGRGMRESILESGEVLMTLSTSAGAMAILLSCIAVGNVVAAGISTRRHEFGVLAACGAQRTVVARLILGETLLMASAACICGVGMGLMLAANGRGLLKDLGGIDLQPSVQWIPITMGCAFLLLMAAAAAAPSTLALLRRSPRELLASAKGS